MYRLLIFALGFITPMAFAATSGGSSTLPEPRPVQSNAEYQPHIGIKGGVTTFDEGYPARGSFGLEAGFQPYVPFALSVEALFTDQSAKTPKPGASKVSRSHLLAKGTYNFGGETELIRYAHVGAVAGTVFDRINDANTTAFAWGPVGGMDFPIATVLDNQRISLGVELTYLFVGGGSPDNVNIDGLAKYWF